MLCYSHLILDYLNRVWTAFSGCKGGFSHYNTTALSNNYIQGSTLTLALVVKISIFKGKGVKAFWTVNWQLISISHDQSVTVCYKHLFLLKSWKRNHFSATCKQMTIDWTFSFRPYGTPYPRNWAPEGPTSIRRLARPSPSTMGGMVASLWRFTNRQVTRVGAVHFRGGIMIRSPLCLQPLMAPPRASTMKLTRKLKNQGKKN